MLKWWWVIALVAAIGIAIMTWMTPRGAPVEFHPAERKVIREYIEEEAKTRLPDVVRITMPLQGRILPIELREGDRVTAGQVVARLDPGDLDTDLLERANTVRRYDKNLQQIDLSIEQAEQTVKASQAKYDFAERLFSRTKALASRNSTTQTDLERDELQMTQAALDLRKEQLNKGLVEIMRGVLELMRESDQARKTQAERDRERAELRCPIDGVVLKAVESNERVMVAGELLLELGKPEDLEIESDILTQDVATIEVGDRVDIEGSAIGKQPIAGRVVRIYPQGFTKVSSLGVEQQRVKVIIEFEPGVLEDLQAKHRRLGVDYRVRVKIETAQKDNALTIPRVAVFRNAEGNWQTFVVRKGRAALTNIVIGLRNDFDVEILSGLSDSDQVILAPDSTLVDGALVESIDDAK